MINTVWGSTDKPVSSKRLAELLSGETDLEGTLYIGYPIIGTPEGSFPIDALLVSPTKGLVLMSALKKEFELAKAADFALEFTYPTEKERKAMTIVNRDMSRAEQERVAKWRSSLVDIIESLETGEAFIEDYPEEVIKKFRVLLDKSTRMSHQ